MQNCEQCGFVYGDVPTTDVPRVFREQHPAYAAVIHAADTPDSLRVRPAPDVWSALEYL